MLKYTFDEGHQTLTTAGTMEEVECAVAFLIGKIYANVKANHPAAAESFRKEITKLVCAENSPLWTSEESGNGVAMVIDPEELIKQVEQAE